MKRRTSSLLTLVLASTLAATALADAPTFTVGAAGYAFNTHLQNWSCDDQSEINPPTTKCHSPHVPASYTFAHHGHVTQNSSTGAYVWMMDGGARDGGFESRVGDTLTTFASPGPQGGTHVLRKTTIEPPAYASHHWELFSTLYDPSRAKFFAFASITETGQLSAARENLLLMGESVTGVDNFTWTKVYESQRPDSLDLGTGILFNNDRYIVDPENPRRFIGLVGWAGRGRAGTAPTYIDLDRRVFGMLFESDGWCEYPLGKVFTGFNAGATCSSAGSALPGYPYEIPGFGKLTKALARIDGKAIVLYPENTAQACADHDDACIQSRTPCPPGQDWTLYKQRRTGGFGTRWWVREMSLATWNTSLGSVQWTGPAKLILDGTQPGQFKISPSDIGVGGYCADMKQFADGRVYLYLTIKHSLCLPASNPPLNAWDRFPSGHSGASMMWLRLNYTP